MKTLHLLLLFVFSLTTLGSAENLLITNVIIYDGSGDPPYRGAVRIEGDHIAAVGRSLKAKDGEAVRDGRGLALAPGFIDMHSHADRGLLENPTADTAIRQGITTALVGQDGGSMYPLADFFNRLEKNPPAMNVASMAGHGTLRRRVMESTLRASTPDELQKLRALVEQEMQSGAFGLSTGLEYDDGHFATTDEIVDLAQIASRHGGFYISHVRDEGNGVFRSFDEVIEIGRRAKIPVQITHIKMATTKVWKLASKRMPQVFAAARRHSVDLKADVYPYTYWQSNLRVIILDRDWFNAKKVATAIAENGGPERLRIARFAPDPSVAGMTLAQIAREWKVTPVEAYMRLVKRILPGPDGEEPDHTVIGESMIEPDVLWFMAHPRIMYSSDGALHDKHPRGAGAFPRILRLARERRLLQLTQAIRKMTSMPAAQLKLLDRGRIANGYKADLVLFDPARVKDTSSVEQPESPPEGITAVMVNGNWVVDGAKVTGARPGKVLRRIVAGKE